MTCGPWFEETEGSIYPIDGSTPREDASKECFVLRRTNKWAEVFYGSRIYLFEVLQEMSGKAVKDTIEARDYALSPRETYQTLDAFWQSLMSSAPQSKKKFYWDYVDNGCSIPVGTPVLATIDSDTLSDKVAEFHAKCPKHPCEDEEAWGLQGCQECYDEQESEYYRGYLSL